MAVKPHELPPSLVLSSPKRNRNDDAASQVPPTKASAGVSFSEWSHRTTPGSSISEHPRSSRASQALSQYGHVAKKKSHALRAKDLWHLILKHVDSEQKDMLGNNLGVQSGTCVVDDLVMQKVQRQLLLLHTLCVEYDQAAEMVGKLARSLTRDQMQQLQVLCDVLGHEDLSDFIRVSVYNTADPFAKHPIEGPDMRAVRAASRARPPKPQPTIPPPPPKRQLNPPLLREEAIRFAGFLPVNHPLSQAAYALAQSQEAWTQYDAQNGSNQFSDQGATCVSMGPGNRRRSQPLSENSSAAHHQPPHQERAHQEHGLNQQQQQQKLYQQQGYHHQQLVYQQQQMEAENGARDDDQMAPLWTDMQRRWSEKNHTTVRDDLLNPVVVGNPMGVYAVLPDFKKKILEAERRAQEQAKHLPRLQIPSYAASTDSPYSPFSPYGRAPSSSGKPVNPHSSRMSQRDRIPNVGTARSEHGVSATAYTLSPSQSYQNLHSPSSQTRFVPSSGGLTNPSTITARAHFESEAKPGNSRPPSNSKGGPDGPHGRGTQETEGIGPHHIPTSLGQLKAPHARPQPSTPPSSIPAKLPNLRPPSTHRLATASQQQ